MKNKIKNDKGAATADIVVAIAILALFATLIVTLAYNIHLQSTLADRTSKAIEYMRRIFEHIDEISYNSLDTQELIDFVDDFNDNKVGAVEGYESSLDTPYKIHIEIDESGTLKTVNVLAKYNVGKKEYSIEMKRMKALTN